MNKTNKIIEDICNSFQRNIGKGSMYCFYNNILPAIVTRIIIKYHSKHPDKQILIVVGNYGIRCDIYNYFAKCNISADTGYDIKILSEDYISINRAYPNEMIIMAGVNNDFKKINALTCDSRFTFCILTKNIMDNDFINNVRKILPFIETPGLADAASYDRIYSPVEEERYGVELSTTAREKYDECVNYINTSMSIFGNIENIDKCKRGDAQLGISSFEFRDMLAKENGWNEYLDTTIPFMAQIDANYNPNILFERACNFFNITKERIDIATDNDEKLQTILDICINNKGKKILIVSKRAEFAAKVTAYINAANIDGCKCGDYHECQEDCIATDNNGNVITYKSGANKGQPRIIKAQARSSANERSFNYGDINILSIKNASSNSLKIACDRLIITSPMVEDIFSLKTRFNNVIFTEIPTRVYKVYSINTIEYDKMIKEKENHLIKIINQTDDEIKICENYSSI